MPVEENKPETHSPHILGSSKCDLLPWRWEARSPQRILMWGPAGPVARSHPNAPLWGWGWTKSVLWSHRWLQKGKDHGWAWQGHWELEVHLQPWWDSRLMSLGPGSVMDLQWWIGKTLVKISFQGLTANTDVFASFGQKIYKGNSTIFVNKFKILWLDIWILS